MTLKGPFYGTETLRRIGRTFCPEGSVLLRPEYGAYTDEGRVGWNPYAARWCTQRAFGANFEAWPELETWPMIGFNHGARVVEMKLLWGAMHGFTSSTINVSNGPRMIAACRPGEAAGRCDRHAAGPGAMAGAGRQP